MLKMGTEDEKTNKVRCILRIIHIFTENSNYGENKS